MLLISSSRIVRSIIVVLALALGIFAPGRAVAETLGGVVSRLSGAWQTQRSAIRPEYREGLWKACEAAGIVDGDPAALPAAEVRDARTLCARLAADAIAACTPTSFDPGRCVNQEIEPLRRGLTRLGPLSTVEQQGFAAVPPVKWRLVAARAPELDRVRPSSWPKASKLCRELGPSPNVTGIDARVLGWARAACVAEARRVETACAAESVGERCDRDLVGWPEIRGAMVAMAATQPELDVIDRVTGSPGYAAMVRHDRAAEITRALDTKKMDRCEAITQLRGLYGAVDDALRARASARTTSARERIDIERYIQSVSVSYDGAIKPLDHPPEDTRLEIAEHAVAALACVPDYRDAPAQLAKANQLVRAVRAHLAAEAACMANPVCRARRIGLQICEARGSRREARQEIAREQSYARQSGVVELRRLAALKHQLEKADDDEAQLGAEYRALAGKRFAGRCK